MVMTIRNILVACFTSLVFFGCAHNSKQVHVLDEKANYKESVPPLELYADGADKKLGQSGPKRMGSKEKVTWFHPHEMPSRDYFMGGWIKLVYEADHWDVEPSKPRKRKKSKRKKKAKRSKAKKSVERDFDRYDRPDRSDYQ